MDPAGLKREIEGQAGALRQFEKQLQTISGAFQESSARQDKNLEALHGQIRQLTLLSQGQPTPVVEPTSPPVRAVPASEPRVSPPERFSGEPGSCRPFLIQCSLAFELQPSAFPTERSKVAYIISLLTDRAKLWGTAEWEKQSPACSSAEMFSAELRKVFDHTASGREAARGLLNLRQGERRVADYSIEFRTIASDSKWNSPSLYDAFYHGLSEKIKDELAARELPSELDSLIDLTIRIDNRMRERRRERFQSAVSRAPVRFSVSTEPVKQLPALPSGPLDDSEPMQLGRTRLTLEERRQRRLENRCMYCGEHGHFVASCPVKERAHQ